MKVIRHPYGAQVLDGLLPLTCPGCGGRGEPVCPTCAATLRHPSDDVRPPAGVDDWAAAFEYRGVARELVARAKYRNVRAVVPWLAAHMVDAATARGFVADAVTWAPTTRVRVRSRGFDPAELFARAVAGGVGSRCSALLRRLPGPPQTGLAAAARRSGPRFEARRRVPRSVLLVDDVATTGATLSAAAIALREGGADRVVALVAARTPAPGARMEPGCGIS